MLRHGRGVFRKTAAARAIGSALGISSLFFAAAAPAGAQESLAKWAPHIDLEARPGTKRDLGEIDYFAPLSQDDRTLYFTSLRGRFDTQGSQEGNLGLGMRRMLDEGWNVGAYGYLDRRRSDSGNYFNQTTLGLEALGRDFDFRGNAYIPFGSKSRSLGTDNGGGPTASLVGATIQVFTPGSVTSAETALKGYDLEAGWRLPLFDVNDSRQLRMYAGGYYFSADGVTVSGPRARLELTLNKLPFLARDMELRVSAETQHDNLRGGQSFLALRLSIPLGSAAERRSNLSWQERRMTAPIVRDVDIVTRSHVTASTPAVTETATATAGGQALTVIDSGSTSGAALQAALNTAGSNSTVILAGTFNTTGTVTMSSGQTLIGGGALSVRSASGQTATLNLANGTISSSTQSTLTMANNATLSGMTIINNFNSSGANGVNAQNMFGVKVSNSVISVSSTSGVFAVDMRNTTNAFFTGNTVTATSPSLGANGIYAQSANNLAVIGNTFTSSTSGPSSNVIAGDNFTNFSSRSSGNVAVSGTCNFSGGAPTGSAGFTNISCP